MLGTKTEWRYARGFSAAVLSLILLLPALLPLAAQPSSSSAMGMACCRTKAKCCCRKAGGAHGGPAVSAKPCGFDCGRIAPAVGNAMAGAPVAVQTHQPVVILAGHLPDRPLTLRSSLTTHNLRQRPPPSFPAA
ncbi:MAG: hypothetical protein NTY38_17895 [Acidobacteria bacterium]|nr:hypothetical protein [Acidobacteriota bacterium]